MAPRLSQKILELPKSRCNLKQENSRKKYHWVPQLKLAKVSTFNFKKFS